MPSWAPISLMVVVLNFTDDKTVVSLSLDCVATATIDDVDTGVRRGYTTCVIYTRG